MQSSNQTIKQSNNFHRGFTILELLVASLLLGMLMTILTMIFSQSSIAWRTGVVGVANMDGARADIADLRCQSDNAYEWNGEHYIQSVFGDDGKVRTEREGANGYISPTFAGAGNLKISLPANNANVKQSYDTKSPRTPSAANGANYIVNVMSWGPDRNPGTRYDNIYSVSPSDDPGEW